METGFMNETNDDLWEMVATASGMPQANIIAGRLASDDIPTRLHTKPPDRSMRSRSTAWAR